MSIDDLMDIYERETLASERRRQKEEEGSPGPLDVVFTQFLRPNGKRRLVWVGVSPELKAQAEDLIAEGFRFECEELPTGKVFLDCCDAEYQLANALVEQGPPIPIAVAELIARAYSNWSSGSYKDT